jgi:hypothetical protein
LEFSRINTSVDEEQAASILAVVPSPANGDVAYVRHHHNASTVSIVDVNGVVLRTVAASTDGNTAIDLSGLANGTYAAVVAGNRGAVTTRFVVLH